MNVAMVQWLMGGAGLLYTTLLSPEGVGHSYMCVSLMSVFYFHGNVQSLLEINGYMTDLRGRADNDKDVLEVVPMHLLLGELDY